MVAGAISLTALLWTLSAAPMGALFDRWGARVFAGAALLVAVGLALAAGAREPWQLYLGMGVAFTDEILLAGGFLDRVPDGIARGNSGSAQQKNGCTGEVFTMPFPIFEEEPGQGRLVCSRPMLWTEPGRISKVLPKESIELPHDLPGSRPRGQIQEGGDF